MKALEYMWIGFAIIGVLMLIFARYVYIVWVGTNVEISPKLSLFVYIYVMILNLGNLYMYLINGIGTVRIQLIIYLSFAIVSWPLMTLACRLWGVEGIVIVPAIVLVFQTVFGKVQLRKLLNKSAKGIWLK